MKKTEKEKRPDSSVQDNTSRGRAGRDKPEDRLSDGQLARPTEKWLKKSRTRD